MLFNLLVVLALIGFVGATAYIWGPILMCQPCFNS